MCTRSEVWIVTCSTEQNRTEPCSTVCVYDRTICMYKHEQARTTHVHCEHRYCGRVHQKSQTQQHNSNTTATLFQIREGPKVERGKKGPAGPGDLLPSFNQQSGNLEKRRLRLHPNPHQPTPLSPLWEAGGAAMEHYGVVRSIMEHYGALWRTAEQHGRCDDGAAKELAR